MEFVKTPVLEVDDRAYFERLADVEERHWWSRAMWRIASYWLDEALQGRHSAAWACDSRVPRVLRTRAEGAATPCGASVVSVARIELTQPLNGRWSAQRTLQDTASTTRNTPWHPEIGDDCRDDSKRRRKLRALDVGCGAGLSARRLLERAEVDEVVGLDPSPEALGHAVRFRGIEFLVGSALELPFEDASFDLVTCFDVFQHLSRGGDRVASSEITRVLRPGGIALIRTNGRGFSGDESCYRLDGLREIVEDTGLTVRRASHANVLPSLAQELSGQLAQRRGAKAPSHPSGGGLTIQVPSPGRNRLMGSIASAEAWVIGRLGLVSRFGHSTLLLAEKPV
jgi:SAM-dependent methyltransferase